MLLGRVDQEQKRNIMNFHSSQDIETYQRDVQNVKKKKEVDENKIAK